MRIYHCIEVDIDLLLQERIKRLITIPQAKILVSMSVEEVTFNTFDDITHELMMIVDEGLY